jgi:hypothetical protein
MGTDAAVRDPEELYERDFYAWTRRQARELRRLARTRPNLPLDLRHIAEEIEDLGRAELHTARSLTRRILEHLLLLRWSPASGPRAHWRRETVSFRLDLEDRLTPSLRRQLARELPELYRRARRGVIAKAEHHGEREALLAAPESCPFTLDQVLGEWWPAEPEAGHGH